MEQTVSLGPSNKYRAGDQVHTLTNETLAMVMPEELYRVYAQPRWWRAMELLEMLYIAKTLGVESDLYRLLDRAMRAEGALTYRLDGQTAEDLILTSGGQLPIEVAIVRKTEELPSQSRIVLQIRKDWAIDSWSQANDTMVQMRTRLACVVLGKEYSLDASKVKETPTEEKDLTRE